MASNFFEQQDVARKKTGRLVGLFIAAVAAIIVLVYVVVLILFVGVIGAGEPDPGQTESGPPYLIAFVVTVIGVVGLIGSCSLYKIATLRSGGGESVARMMGGRLLHPDASAFHERKILNVVEEMALASGTPVPPVYLMDNEKGINAFAAGYAPESAVIGITRGAVEQLSRDELQGVVAHEFSHILNGDMRLNIRLMGVIFGLIALAVVGRIILHTAVYSGGGRNKKDNGGVLAILAFGVALMIIGGIGVLFGQLIQAAVSRQREFLADASAVQFTRNPDTIGGALKRIGGFGSFVSDGHAGEASHMFIAKHANAWAFGPFATHPPIEERIKRVDPGWDGSFPEPRNPDLYRSESQPKRSQKASVRDKLDAISGLPGAVIDAAILAEAGGAVRQQPEPQGVSEATPSAIDQVGSVSPAHVAYMRELLGSIPETLRAAAQDPFSARAVVYGLLLDRSVEVRDKQTQYLAQRIDAPVRQALQSIAPAISELPAEARLPLIDLSVPALREMSGSQYEAFKTNVDELVKADGRVELFEWTLERLLLRHLDAHFDPKPDPKPRYYNLKPLAEPCTTVLSALAHIGQRDKDQAQSAFESGMAALGLAGQAMLDRSQVKLSAVGMALDTLLLVSPREKQKLVTACAKTIAVDGKVSRGEAELMRAVADAIGVPMPPLLPGQPLV